MRREQKRLIKRINEWLLTHGIKNFVVLDDLSVNVFSDVDLSGRGLEEIPIYVNFNEVKGTFDCSVNSLRSLRGCPRLVHGNFYCFKNRLSTLDHSPEEVRGKFFCHGNDRQFTREEVTSECDVNVIFC